MMNKELNVLWRRDFFPYPYLSVAVTGRAFISEPLKLSHDPWILHLQVTDSSIPSPNLFRSR